MSEFEMKHIAVIVVFDVRTSGLGIVAAVQAHNGMVPDIVGRPSPFSTCRPEGQTDSEFAFCQLLAGIVDRYDPNDLYRWLDRLKECTTEIAVLGKFNFLLSDGSVLIAHGHDRLHHAERSDGVALVATEPLDDGQWQPFAPGELRVYRSGSLLASHRVTSEHDACSL